MDFLSLKAGDILNILSAVFFGIHMLRTEHISRTTEKEKIMALLGYEVGSANASSIFCSILHIVSPQHLSYKFHSQISLLDLGVHCGLIIGHLVSTERYFWQCALLEPRYMDMVHDVGLDKFIPLDTCIVHRGVLYWFMLMGGGLSIPFFSILFS